MMFNKELSDEEILGNHDNYPNVVYVDKNGHRCNHQTVNYLVRSRERYVKSSSISNTGKEFMVRNSFEGHKEELSPHLYYTLNRRSKQRKRTPSGSNYSDSYSDLNYRGRRSGSENSSLLYDDIYDQCSYKSSGRDHISPFRESENSKKESNNMSTLQKSFNFLKIGKNDSYRKRSSITTLDSSDNGDKFSSMGIESTDEIRSTSNSASSDITTSTECDRKAKYRVGLNLFNRNPEIGIKYLADSGFIGRMPEDIAEFLLLRQGISRKKIGEYLGKLQNPFNMKVLSCFVDSFDFHGLYLDEALRKFQKYYWMPGEAQQIERLVQEFSRRYSICNPEFMRRLRSPDTVFVLAFAIILLNTDLHNTKMKEELKMKCEDFVKNLRGIDESYDVDRTLLVDIYDRIKMNEFQPLNDHVKQVIEFQSRFNSDKLDLAEPHRRLVCYCRLYEIDIVTESTKVNLHQREVFLFNDLIVIAKISNSNNKKKNADLNLILVAIFHLANLNTDFIDCEDFPYSLRLYDKANNQTIVLQARNSHDKKSFITDLKQNIYEDSETKRYLTIYK